MALEVYRLREHFLQDSVPRHVSQNNPELQPQYLHHFLKILCLDKAKVYPAWKTAFPYEKQEAFL